MAADPRRGSAPRGPDVRPRYAERPVEFWSTAAIRAALQSGDIETWQRIVVALKRDPFGRTARQVEEVLEGTQPFGISKALSEVLTRTRAHLEANERVESSRHMRVLIDRSGLSGQEFASRIGVPPADLKDYLDGTVSPPASLMIRMRRLSDRFVKLNAQRSTETT
ncbi:MAG: XRE family transcriptional regulator [Mycobacterium sp.]